MGSSWTKACFRSCSLWIPEDTVFPPLSAMVDWARTVDGLEITLPEKKPCDRTYAF